MTDLTLWSAGWPLDEFGTIGDDLGFSTVFGDQGCGLDQVTWSMSLPKGFAHPAVQAGARVQLKVGDITVGTAVLDQPDVDAWTFTANGLIHRASELAAVNSAGTPTASVKDALTAQADAWGITLPPLLPDWTVTLDSADQVLMLDELLSRANSEHQVRWGVTGDGVFQFFPTPTSPSYAFTEDAPSLPSASSTGVNYLRIRYAVTVDDSGNPTSLAMTEVFKLPLRNRRIEQIQDLTDQGALTEAQAQTLGQQILANLSPQDTLGSGITTGPGQVTTIGDTPMDGAEWMVAADVGEGAMFRHMGWRNPDVGTAGSHDWIAGAASWSKANGGLTVTPLGMAASTFSDIMADLRTGITDAKGTASTAKALATPDWLRSLINPSSQTTVGGIPATAAVGDIAVIGSDAYICTTAYSTGGTLEVNWTQAKDPTTIALVVSTAMAVFAADNANAAAVAAQQSADGKNTIRYAASAPTTSTAGSIGDTTYVFSGGQITAQYRLTTISGSTYTWSLMQITSAVIANLDVGKITGAIASFLQANITSLSSVYITTSTMTSSDGSIAFEGTNNRFAFYSGGTLMAHINYLGAWADSVDHFKVSPNLWVGGSGTGTLTVGVVDADELWFNNSAWTSTSAPNVYVGPGGRLYQTSGSSRALKHSIEPFEPDDDLAALERCGVFAYHYYADESARMMIGLIIEDMLAAGLRRYVDYDEDGNPIQPAWQQITALLITAHQRDRRDIAALDTRLTALEAP